MGNYKIVIEGTGGHGCQRDLGDGEKVEGCGLPHCPDCLARDFVGVLRNRGETIRSASFTHWPEREDGGIVDDLVTGIRTNSF